MKNALYALIVLVSFYCFSCENDPPVTPSDSSNTIMPLGASRVQGARPLYESYRYELWKRLVEGGFDFDYIGTRMDNANYPNFNNQVFDDDHEGRGGWTSGQILNGIDNWLATAGSPDFVLFSSPGGNDALQNLDYDTAIDNINSIIDIIQGVNPNVTILIEQLAPGQSALMTPTLTEYFNRLQQDALLIAEQQSTATSQVIAVDMASGFTDAMLADAVHYNVAGAVFIADRYYDLLDDLLEE